MIEAVIERCAGIDVGKKFLVVSVMTGPLEAELKVEIRKFGTIVRACAFHHGVAATFLDEPIAKKFQLGDNTTSRLSSKMLKIGFQFTRSRIYIPYQPEGSDNFRNNGSFLAPGNQGGIQSGLPRSARYGWMPSLPRGFRKRGDRDPEALDRLYDSCQGVSVSRLCDISIRMIVVCGVNIGLRLGCGEHQNRNP
jgi:hypothetical protein